MKELHCPLCNEKRLTKYYFWICMCGKTTIKMPSDLEDLIMITIHYNYHTFIFNTATNTIDVYKKSQRILQYEITLDKLSKQTLDNCMNLKIL